MMRLAGGGRSAWIQGPSTARTRGGQPRHPASFSALYPSPFFAALPLRRNAQLERSYLQNVSEVVPPCAWRRSCIRTLKSRPEALTAGSHIRVRKVLREIGVPASVANKSSSLPRPFLEMCCAMGIQPLLAHTKGPSLVIFRVRLNDHALAHR
jgi:hypothetical protein